MQTEQLWFGLITLYTVFDVGIVGIPYDNSACYRKGSALAPNKIRELSTLIPPTIETRKILDLGIKDFGNISVTQEFQTTSHIIETQIPLFSHSDVFLLFIGGDHSITIPIFNTLARYRNAKKLGMIYIDAHADISNELYGNKYSNGCVLRRILESSTVLPENLALIGVRSYEPDEIAFINENNIKIYSTEEAIYNVKNVLQDIRTNFEKLDKIYLSIDIDVLDPSCAPGTGIPEAGGLSTRELIKIIRGLESLNLFAADIVEVSPPLDNSDITSFAALKIILEILNLVQKQKNLLV
ncbi:MAG: agmatinase [Nitrospirota bacterium]